MRQVTRFQTSDGEEHKSLKDAQNHAQKRYGDLLTKLAHQAVRIEKYSEMCEFIDGHLSNFSMLMDLRKDESLEAPDG